MDNRIHYGVFKDLFKALGINPYDFWVLSGDRVRGHFPDLEYREPRISVDKLANLIWEDN